MAKAIEITLGGDTYQVRPFNLDQLERITDLSSLPPAKIAFKAFRIAMERCEPAVNPDELEMSQQEFQVAMGKLMGGTGMENVAQAVAAQPGGAQPPTEGAT